MMPLPDYGDLMTREEFIANVQDGLFTDYDGSGNYSDGKLMLWGKDVYPSNVFFGNLQSEWSHIVWFNK